MTAAPADAASLPRIANAQQRLTIIVAGPKELTTTLNAGRPMVFNPLRLQETREYIQQSLAIAGRSTNPFDESAIKAIHHCSGGRIKRMGEAAEQAMELAYRLGLRQIRARHIGQLTHCHRAAG